MAWRQRVSPAMRMTWVWYLDSPQEIIPANNCTMQGQNNWGNWGSLSVMKLGVEWEVFCWLMKFRELCSGGFHPKLVMPPYHGFLNVNTPPNSQNSKWHYVQRDTQGPVGKHNAVYSWYIAVGGFQAMVPRYKWECDISGDYHEPKSRPSFPVRCERW